MRIVVVDHYDSFSHNVAGVLETLGAEVEVVRMDASDLLRRVRDPAVRGVVLGPGPGHPAVPQDMGHTDRILFEGLDVPILGICLGMQAMARHLGLRVETLPHPVHGKSTLVQLAGSQTFPTGSYEVGRYHSLHAVVGPDASPTDLHITAQAADGTILAMEHPQRGWFGFQFHPESILTPDGPRLLDAFLRHCDPTFEPPPEITP